MLIKQECDKSKIIYKEFIRINNTTIPFQIPQLIGLSDVEIKGYLSADAYTDGTFFGTFNMKMLKFETENNIDYKGKEFDYYKVVNGEEIYIGKFIVTEVKNSDTFQNVIVTAYDYALKFANKYKSNLDYGSGNVTLSDVINECCEKCNIELENTSLTNGNIIIQTNPEGADRQFGTIIAYAAALQGKFATINDNNKLEFILEKSTIGSGDNLVTENNDLLLLEDGDELLTDELDVIEDYVELDDKRDTRPITCVMVGLENEEEGFSAVAKDDSLIKIYGENWLKILNNPLVQSSQKALEFANGILQSVKGFGYSAFESKYTFKPYLKLGHIVYIKAKDGSIRKSNILRITSNYDDITLQAPSIINASIEYEQPTTPYDGINQAYIDIDKANGKININAQKIGQANSQIVLKANANGKIVKASLEADASQGSTFDVSADNINFNGKNFNLGTENLSISSNNFNLDSGGNLTCSNANVTGTINATSGSFTGTITSTNGSVGGWNMNNDGLIKDGIFIKKNGVTNIYTATDVMICKAIIYGEQWAQVTAGSPQFKRYDINNDGVINNVDLLLLQKMVYGDE